LYNGALVRYEVGIQFGAGGTSAAEELAAESTRNPEWPIIQAKRFLAAGASVIMVESEGMTERVRAWRTDVPAKFVNALGLDAVMFAAAAPAISIPGSPAAQSRAGGGP
jgi:phosphosulfolactate synthase (CoM biosynthesis protein A)